MSASTIPEGWTERESQDALYQWSHSGHEMLVSVSKLSRSEYLVLVEQYITADGLTSRVTTHGASFDDEDTAHGRAIDIMAEASDGKHVVDTLCAFQQNDVVDFVAVYRDDVPPGVTVDELEDVVRAHLGDGDPDDLERKTEDFVGEDSITIDVFPRPVTHVSNSDDVEVGDPTTITDGADELDNGD